MSCGMVVLGGVVWEAGGGKGVGFGFGEKRRWRGGSFAGRVVLGVRILGRCI
jgi:hypothetical protein